MLDILDGVQEFGIVPVHGEIHFILGFDKYSIQCYTVFLLNSNKDMKNVES